MTKTGQRYRKAFPSETKAERFASKLRALYNRGHRTSVIPEALAREAALAQQVLDGSGISLLEAARMAVARSRDAQGSETFAERLQRAMAANADHWSERYALDVAKIPAWVPRSFMALKCGLIDRPEMERAIMEVGQFSRSTIDARCRYISAVLGFRERHRKSRDIAIMSEEQIGVMLESCVMLEHKRVVALLLFAGIRPDLYHGEISRLDWSAVGKKEIYMSREVSKVSDRHIPITPRLRRLIKGHPSSGPVMPPNWQRVWPKLRKAASVVATDITRHTFASHFLAAFGEDKTKAAMGHTAGSDTLFRHYRRAVTEADGQRYFR